MRTRWSAFIAAPLVVMPAAHATTYLTVEQAQQVLFPGASFTPVDVKRKERVWRVSAGWFVVRGQDGTKVRLGQFLGGTTDLFNEMKERAPGIALQVDRAVAMWKGR